MAATLLDLEQHTALGELLQQYDETSAVWRYAQALLEFRSRGDTEEARRWLGEARSLDPRFLDYLFGDAMVYTDRVVRFGRDAEESVHSLARLFLPAWRATPGAVTWARHALRIPLVSPGVATEMPLGDLRALPRRKLTWQIGLHLLDAADPADNQPPIWLLGVADVRANKLLGMTVIEGEPEPHVVWDAILEVISKPLEGSPHRPARLVVPRRELHRAWKEPLAEINVTCVHKKDPQPIGQLLGAMAQVVRNWELAEVPPDIEPGRFPQTSDVWQADFFHVPTFISNDQVGVARPWTALVMDKQTRTLLAREMLNGEPTSETLWDHLVRSMARTKQGDPMRPSVVEVSDSDSYDFLKSRLSELGVRCVLADELPELHAFCRGLAASYGTPDKCALADGSGVTMVQMETFYHAAAQYFRSAPWKWVHGEIPIKIRCRGLGVGTRWAVVLGRTGVTLGLSVYHTWDSLLHILTGWGPRDTMPKLGIVFDEITIMAPLDLYLTERQGWPIATPEAYPVIMRFEPHRKPLSASGLDLDYLSCCLQVVPDFVRQGGEAKSYEVKLPTQSIKMRLSWDGLDSRHKR